MRDSLRRHTCCLRVLVAGCLFAQAAAAAGTEASRFALSGTASLTPDAPLQRSAGFRLQAQLAPLQSSTPAQAPWAQTGAAFALIAYADSVATACYNDTIFRNDFDADGL
jgi:hypothetical protein